MKVVRLFLLLVLISGSGFVRHAQALPQGQAGALPPSSPSVAVRILAPNQGETLGSNYVTVRYEPTRPALSDEPNFLVQLDSQDPVVTSETTKTFSDLQPGTHTVRITMVDANNTPVQGGTAIVHFTTVAPQPRRGAADNSPEALASMVPTVPVPVPAELLANSELSIPVRNSPLPLLALIGFALLSAGSARAMRTR